jgi:heat shock protein 5
MVEEAEKFSEQDKLVKEKLEAKHQLENYIHQMRNTIEDKEKLKDKLEADDKKTIEEALKKETDWIAANEEAEKDDLEEHFKALQKVCDPIIAKVYQKQGGQAGKDGGDGGKDDEEFEDL